MIRLVHHLTSALALGPQGQQALDATFADWRHEIGAARTQKRRVVVTVRSVWAVCRAIGRAGISELPKAAGSLLLLRTAVVCLFLIAWTLRNGAPGGTDRFFLVTSDAKAWAAVAASLAPYCIGLFPLMVFFSEAVGRRHSATSMVGGMTLLAGIAAGLVFFVLPAATVYLRYETWRYFANASVPEPRIDVLLHGALPVAFALAVALTFVVGTLALFVLANRIRRVGRLAGWLVGSTPFVFVLASNYAISLAQQSVNAGNFWVFLRLTTPLAAVAALIWASVTLARIEGSSARPTPRPTS